MPIPNEFEELASPTEPLKVTERARRLQLVSDKALTRLLELVDYIDTPNEARAVLATVAGLDFAWSEEEEEEKEWRVELNLSHPKPAFPVAATIAEHFKIDREKAQELFIALQKEHGLKPRDSIKNGNPISSDEE